MKKSDTDYECYDDMLDDLKLILQSQIRILKDKSEKKSLTVSENKTLLELVRQVKQLAQEELEAALKLSDDALNKIDQRERKAKSRRNESIGENSPQGAEGQEKDSERESD